MRKFVQQHENRDGSCAIPRSLSELPAPIFGTRWQSSHPRSLPIHASVLPSERLLSTQFADSRHLPPSCTRSSAAWSRCEDGGEAAAGVTTAPVRCSARLGAFVVNRLANAMLGTSNMRYQMAERAIIGNQRQRHKTNTTICEWPKNESFPATRGAKTRNG